MLKSQHTFLLQYTSWTHHNTLKGANGKGKDLEPWISLSLFLLQTSHGYGSNTKQNQMTYLCKATLTKSIKMYSIVLFKMFVRKLLRCHLPLYAKEATTWYGMCALMFCEYCTIINYWLCEVTLQWNACWYPVLVLIAQRVICKKTYMGGDDNWMTTIATQKIFMELFNCHWNKPLVFLYTTTHIETYQ